VAARVPTPSRRSGWWLALLACVACGNNFHPEQYPTPESLLEASRAAYQRGDCGDAIRGLTRLLFEFQPRDPRVAQVRYLMGECRVRQGDRLQAAQEFRRVADEFPSHELAPTALLRAGDAEADMWRRVELDPTYGERALSTYTEVQSRFPSSEAAAQARERAAVLADRFALKELKTGDFYFRLRAYDSAIIYFRSVVANYTESRHAPVALLRLVETYRKIGYAEEAAETCDHLRRFYPAHEGVPEACPAPPGP
jgi:outer membrane protein assembly factor BamD